MDHGGKEPNGLYEEKSAGGNQVSKSHLMFGIMRTFKISTRFYQVWEKASAQAVSIIALLKGIGGGYSSMQMLKDRIVKTDKLSV